MHTKEKDRKIVSYCNYKYASLSITFRFVSIAFAVDDDAEHLEIFICGCCIINKQTN